MRIFDTCVFSAEGTLIFCVHSVLSWACLVDRAMLTQCKVSPAENGDADASSTSCRPARDGNNACPSRSSLNVPQHLPRSESAPANSLFGFFLLSYWILHWVTTFTERSPASSAFSISSCKQFVLSFIYYRTGYWGTTLTERAPTSSAFSVSSCKQFVLVFITIVLVIALGHNHPLLSVSLYTSLL